MTRSQTVIQADYDPLTQIALHCDDCGQHVQAGYATLVNQIDRLRMGEWEGDAATLFYASMDQDVLPAIERLKTALYASHTTLQELVRLFQSADEEAADIFNLDDSPASNGFSGNGAIPIAGLPKGGNAFYKIDPSQGGGGVYQDGGERNEIYEAIGPMTDEERAFVDAILDYHETGEYEDGFMVEIENPEDVVDVFETIRNLDSYGVNLDGDKPWTIEEVNVVNSVVTSISYDLYGLATSMGYNIGDPRTLFREVYGYENGEFTIERGARDDGYVHVGKNADGEDIWAYGVNRGNGVIELGDRAFYNPANGDMWSETNLGVLGSSNLRFTVETLIGHEINHTINWKVHHEWRKTGVHPIVIDGNHIDLDAYYHDNMWDDETHTFDHTYQFTYTNDDGELVTGTISRADNIALYDESGFTNLARSESARYETVTDALNAYTLDLYTIGPEFNYDQNVAGLARQEQGQLLWEAVLIDRLGEPRPNIPL